MDIDQFKNLVRSAVSESDREPVQAYILEKNERKLTPFDINRIAGNPIGITDSRWPLFNGKKMFHVFTVDLNDVPRLKEKFSSEIRAFALFISDTVDLVADEPFNLHTKILELTQKDLACGVNEDSPTYDENYKEPIEGSFKSHEIEFPAELFYDYDVYDDLSDSVKAILENMEFTIAGGRPIWLRGSKHTNDVLVQFDEYFYEMNLGYGGTLYVYKDTAFMNH